MVDCVQTLCGLGKNAVSHCLWLQKLQEETRLAQYAMQKFKTELGIMETSVMLKYQMAYEDMTREERWVTGQIDIR